MEAERHAKIRLRAALVTCIVAKDTIHNRNKIMWVKLHVRSEIGAAYRHVSKIIVTVIQTLRTWTDSLEVAALLFQSARREYVRWCAKADTNCRVRESSVVKDLGLGRPRRV